MRTTLLSLFLLLGSIVALAKVENKMPSWFGTEKCEKLRIVEFKSAVNSKIVNEVLIEDPHFIRSFQTQIQTLPTQGEMMIKMGPDAKKMELQFTCKGKIETIEFYNRKIKTPATSFYDSEVKKEKEILYEVESMLAKPKLGHAAPKALEHILKYGDFEITYKGEKDETPKGTTATLNIETYLVTDTSNKTTQEVRVSSGQLPPKNVHFKVGRKNYILMTYYSKNEKSVNSKIIYPRQIIIEK